MNLRNLGYQYESETATIWINPANSPMMVDVIRSQLDRIQPFDLQAKVTGDHTINNARLFFIVAEGYVLDVDFKLNTTLKTYYDSRDALTIEQRWYAFLMMVERGDCDILDEAYSASRPNAVQETETDNGKKNKKSSELPEITLESDVAQPV